MIWADRIAVVWALCVAGFFLLVGNGANVGPDVWLKALAILVGVPWLLLRGIHFIATGRLGSIAAPLRTGERWRR
jgi:hypothetical protein